MTSPAPLPTFQAEPPAESLFSAAHLLRLSILVLIPLAIILLGAAAGPHFLPDQRPVTTNLAQRMFYWDAPWYDDIGGKGYHWAPVSGPPLGHYQNVAFFPLYAIIDHIVTVTTGSPAAWLLILPSLLFGIGSIIAFDRLSRLLLPARTAFWATLCFGLWPGACFMLMGYPTSLINLCGINAIYHFIRRQPWRAGLWCGLGAAAGPPAVFIAMGLCLSRFVTWLRAGHKIAEIPAAIGFGLLSVSGLLAYMLFLFIKFHDPFVFSEAQDGWVIPQTVSAHLQRFFDPAWYYQITGLFADIYHFFLSPAAATPGMQQSIGMNSQQILSFVAVFFTAVILIWAALTRHPNALIFSGWIILIGYLWFIATTSAYFLDGPRLLYPVLALYLVCGGWAARSILARFMLIGSFAILSFMEAALASTGYAVN